MDVVEPERRDEEIRSAEERAVYGLAGHLRDAILELPSESKLGLVFLRHAEMLEMWARLHIARVVSVDGELEQIEESLLESGLRRCGMTTLNTDQLASRVRSVLATETRAGTDPLSDAAHSLLPPRPEGSYLAERELDLMDWSLAVGLAFGIARMEDPCESLESVGERAAAAAKIAFAEGDWDSLARLQGVAEAVPAVTTATVDGKLWDTHAEFEIGMFIARYLEQHPAPPGSLAEDLRVSSDNLLEAAHNDLAFFGERHLQPVGGEA